MTDPENTSQPLLAAPNQQAQSVRPSRAYKVAGLTMLACVLIVGQVVIAYFLLSQRSDIKSLKEQSSGLQSELTKGRSVAVPVQMHRPMNALPVLMDTLDEEASTGVTEKNDALPATSCQLEAAGLKPVRVPNFRPKCDESGRYQVQQCFMRSCWCVNPTNGEMIPGSMSNGAAQCDLFTGGMRKLLPAPDIVN